MDSSAVGVVMDKEIFNGQEKEFIYGQEEF